MKAMMFLRETIYESEQNEMHFIMKLIDELASEKFEEKASSNERKTSGSI